MCLPFTTLIPLRCLKSHSTDHHFVINNNGGAIFDMLPVEADVKEKYYRMPHHLEFSQLAQTFDLKYARPYTWADLGAVLKLPIHAVKPH